MLLSWIDWTIIGLVLASILVITRLMRQYMQSVADFLVASRSAGRYLLAVSAGTAGMGAITIVATFEVYYKAGFTALWWSLMITPVLMLTSISGWVVYRYRETRAMTMAQFFEMRYSRRFRVFSGIIGWLSGIINFGIFPAVAANFFIYFCGLPRTVPWLGVPTFPLLMIGLLAVAIFIVFSGGQIAVMITDFLQGIFAFVVMLLIAGLFFYYFNWSQVVGVLQTAPEQASRINPFRTSRLESFNMWFYLIGAVGVIYHYRAWQGRAAYSNSAKSAHEQKFAGILGEWRLQVLILVTLLMPIGAWVVMHSDLYPGVAEQSQATLDGISSQGVGSQMITPIVLTHLLPIGIKGLLAAMMLTAFISTCNTYLHSWGAMFVQDVILPFRNKPFTTREHFWLLRLSILFVAVFVFCFSLMFTQMEEIMMFFAVTAAIYLGGVGSVIIGGLYWKHGSTRGAWAALTLGVIVAGGGLILRQYWVSDVYGWLNTYAPWSLTTLSYGLEGIAQRVPGINWEVGPDRFFMNGKWVSALAMLFSIGAYVGLSLWDWLVLGKPAHNMDRLLHRGDYAVAHDHVGDDTAQARPVTGWRTLLPTPEFTWRDKIIYSLKIFWSVGWIIVFIAGTIYNLIYDVSDQSWATFWWIKVWITAFVAGATVIWFTCGGIMDLRYLFRTLRTAKRDYSDTGMVHHPEPDDHPRQAVHRH